MSETFYERRIHTNIKPYLSTKDIVVIQGARQTGKTTLLKMIQRDLQSKDCGYIDLEDSRLLEICNEGPERMIQYLKEKGTLKNQKKFYLFVDEIQYLNNPSSLMKLIHDHYSNLKLIVSGSSSFAIRKRFQDSLTGRTVHFELYPLDFQEFLTFKGHKYDIKKPITVNAVIAEMTALFCEYVKFGGYPKIVLTESQEMKEKYLQQIIDTYIRKDIADMANIRDIVKFNKLVRILAEQSGRLLNVSELANIIQLARQTVEEYLTILEQTYVIKRLPPFTGNLRSELFKTHKIYLYDTGLMQVLWLKSIPGEIIGNVFETAIFSELIKKFGEDSLFFWRTQDGKEIDFIIQNKRRIFPMEVKINVSSVKMTALRYFSRHYTSEKAIIVSLEGKLGVKKVDLRQLRPWDIGRII